MVDSGLKNAAQVSAEDIGLCAREKLCEMLGLSPRIEAADAEDRWFDATAMLFRVCSEQTETTWSELTRSFATLAAPQMNYAAASDEMRILWEAATRHAVNLIMVEDRQEFDEAKNYDWSEWMQRRRVAAGTTQTTGANDE